MRPQPISIREASRLCSMWHRHLDGRGRALFAVGVSDGRALVGVAIVGRPVARHLQDGTTVEVLRVATVDGAQLGACSWLYARCRRIAYALGYARLITYTLASESGASPRGAGFTQAAEIPAAPGWNRKKRPRKASPVDNTAKIRWEAATA